MIDLPKFTTNVDLNCIEVKERTHYDIGEYQGVDSKCFEVIMANGETDDGDWSLLCSRLEIARSFPAIQRNPSDRPSAALLLEHPFVKNVAPLERCMPSSMPSEATPSVDETILIIDLSVFFAVDRIQHRGRRLRHLDGNHSSWQSLPVNTAIEFSSTAPEDSSEVSTISSPPLINPKYLRPFRTRTMRISQRSFSRKSRIPIDTKILSVAELQAATDFFSEQPKQFGNGRISNPQKPASDQRLVRSYSLTDLLRSHDGYSSHSSSLTDDEAKDALYGKNEVEKTIRAIYAQKAEHPVCEVVHGELYQAMRKELRYAVEEIRTELEQDYYYVLRDRALILSLFLPAVVRPILDSFESSKQVPQPSLSDVSIKFGTCYQIFTIDLFCGYSEVILLC
ncbi:hypothetical protein POM88_003762 [Heracleum sosnowskyi]|uniref:Uncharacterized protein n=1 Tax=Heracleum sosnowskyi TaxID=360622 RepID=A0AAD8JKH3_9APIA|nr:hypothetical protein POM88_003762 [Heracleum sosnowskyi]